MNKDIKKPNFFILGAPKCATTSFSEYLKQHPNIFIDRKEIKYFNTDFSKEVRKVHSKEEYLNHFEGAENFKAVGEATVWYLFSDDAVDNILDFNPKSKFIVMVRNPVDLFHSLHSQKLLELEETVSDPKRAWELRTQRRKGEKIPSTCRESKILQYERICKLGAQLKDLIEKVSEPSEKIKVIRLSDLKKDPKKVYEDVLDFLGLESDGKERFPVYNQNESLRTQILPKLIYFNKKGFLKKVSNYLKNIDWINSTLKRFNDWNKKDQNRQELDPEFRDELNKHFEEDQKLLGNIIEKYNLTYEEK